jgi:isocitrate dehydrogenase
MAYKHIKVPSSGEKIRVNQDISLTVPDTPIIPTSRATALGSISPR